MCIYIYSHAPTYTDIRRHISYIHVYLTRTTIPMQMCGHTSVDIQGNARVSDISLRVHMCIDIVYEHVHVHVCTCGSCTYTDTCTVSTHACMQASSRTCARASARGETQRERERAAPRCSWACPTRTVIMDPTGFFFHTATTTLQQHSWP